MTCATCDAPLTTARERLELLCARHIAGAAPECAVCGGPLSPNAHKDRCRRCQQQASNRERMRAWREAGRHPCADCGVIVSAAAVRCVSCGATAREAAKRGRAA